MNTTDRIVALAQIWLSVIYLTGTFAVILIYELGLAKMTAEQDKTFGNLANWLTGGGLIVLYFWFQRQRASNTPDPTTTTTKTEVTTTPSEPTP